MSDLLLSQTTRQALERFLAHPSHALLIVGPSGSGKAALAQHIAAMLLQVPDAKLIGNPYFKHLAQADRKSISIEEIRDVIHFTTLRIPGSSATNRVILIEGAHLMTVQAQNALLKTIEEPPAGTSILLTAPTEIAILPTIRSRAQNMTVHPPDSPAVITYFTHEGFTPEQVKKTFQMSGGLVGLMDAMLRGADDHPLIEAAAIARTLIPQPTYERLLAVDGLAKQPQLWQDILSVMERMAELSLQQGKNGPAKNRQWQHILAACYDARLAMQRNTQTKLVVLNFMLTM